MLVDAVVRVQKSQYPPHVTLDLDIRRVRGKTKGLFQRFRIVLAVLGQNALDCVFSLHGFDGSGCGELPLLLRCTFLPCACFVRNI